MLVYLYDCIIALLHKYEYIYKDKETANENQKK